jgi:glycerol-3-phosphate acyltransferase PlsY
MALDTHSSLALVACAVGGYLIGSISFGLIAMRLGGAGDIRKIGSGSIGATNVLRTGRRDLALITLIGDAGKGAVAVLLAGAVVGPVGASLAGGFAFLGHLYPVWLKFRGGKGVATFFGILLTIAWPVGIATGLVWIAMAAIFRISSLAGLAAALSAPAMLMLIHRETPANLILLIATAVLIVLRHRENIVRIAKGAEPRIGAGKTPPAQ